MEEELEEENFRAKKQKTMSDEASTERNKSFVTALQELKNLRPQLYSAAEYCEKSYLHSDQKQMVLDNLKDYAVRALVNAIDHLGTVAYKLNDILEQQKLDISSIDLKVTCLNQRLLTCQTYTDREGLRQQQLLPVIPRHHKHYILPNSGKKRVQSNPPIQTDLTQPIHARGASVAKTLSWHLASEAKSKLKRSARSIISTEYLKTNGKTFGPFYLSDAEGKTRIKSAPATTVAMQTLGVVRRDSVKGTKPITEHGSFDNTTQKEIARPHARSKSKLSSLFVKQKTANVKTNT